jgi:glycosyltransferase involved in cell wall biosynthesis
MTNPPIPKARIYHGSLWARYKGAIFSRVYADHENCGLDVAFVHIAETSKARVSLSGVDRTYHQYPYEILFPSVYESVPTRKVVAKVICDLLKHPSELVVMPGYHRPEYWAMLFVCILLRRKRAVFVDSTAYDRPKSRFKEAAKRFFFRRCNGFFCYGIRSKEYVASYGVDERKISYRCQAAALPHDYDVAAVRRYYRERPPGMKNGPRFLFVGRLSAEKGLYDLLEAFKAARADLPAARLDIVGSGSIERELKDCVKSDDLESAVAFLGTKSVEEIGELLMHSDTLVLPSHSEPWGLVVNEALSYGCPVVVSDICGCVPELVVDGNSGFSYPSGDVPGLTAAMIAAAELAADRAAVATRCLDLIGQYSADNAALEILRGCVRILKTPE